MHGIRLTLCHPDSRLHDRFQRRSSSRLGWSKLLIWKGQTKNFRKSYVNQIQMTIQRKIDSFYGQNRPIGSTLMIFVGSYNYTHCMTNFLHRHILKHALSRTWIAWFSSQNIPAKYVRQQLSHHVIETKFEHVKVEYINSHVSFYGQNPSKGCIQFIAYICIPIYTTGCE